VVVGRLRKAVERAEGQQPLVKAERVETSDEEAADLEERLKLLGYL
jgi:hypothetical protein